jgi:hypothetical protein
LKSSTEQTRLVAPPFSSHNSIIRNTLRMPKGVTTWGFSSLKWLSTKGSHTSWSSGEWAVEHGFPFHIQQNQWRPYQHRDHSITCFIRKKITQAKSSALFLYFNNNKPTSDPLRISTCDCKVRGFQQFQLWRQQICVIYSNEPAALAGGWTPSFYQNINDLSISASTASSRACVSFCGKHQSRMGR